MAGIITGEAIIEQAEDLLRKIEEFFTDLQRPKQFRTGHAENVIVMMDLSYEELCALLESNGTQNPKRLTMFEFYSRLAYLKKAGPKLTL